MLPNQLQSCFSTCSVQLLFSLASFLQFADFHEFLRRFWDICVFVVEVSGFCFSYVFHVQFFCSCESWAVGVDSEMPALKSERATFTQEYSSPMHFMRVMLELHSAVNLSFFHVLSYNGKWQVYICPLFHFLEQH